MEEKFIAAWAAARSKAETYGVRMRPVLPEDAMKTARRTLSGKGPYRPEEAMTVEEALRSYTIESAHASFEENVKGLIAPGYLADFTVLDNDPFTVLPADIGTLSVQGQLTLLLSSVPRKQ